MTTPKIDELTGVATTGHEWDGLTELNNPLPRWWLYVLYACIVFAVIYSFFVPPIPGVEGLLPTTRAQLKIDLAAAREGQAGFLAGIESSDVAQIRADAELLSFAVAGGASAFAENCTPCHGAGGAGGPGYPSLADDVWQWGGTLADIQTTIEHGIRSDDPDTRWSEMMAFGRDGILPGDQIVDVANYVAALSGQEADREAAGRGEQVFADNCAICHGDKGQGDPLQGAPALADAVWLYGGSLAQIEAQIENPKHGMMPAWSGRLDDATIKMLTIYVSTLGGYKE
jgi:cytochrome c oxidase cbb3-type subunit 3